MTSCLLLSVTFIIGLQLQLHFRFEVTSHMSCSCVVLSLYEDAATLVNATTYPELADVDPTGRKS